MPQERVVELQQENGGPLGPLSLPSSRASPNEATLPNGFITPRGPTPREDNPFTLGSSSTSSIPPQKRPRGRPRKNTQN
jgi:hypothetical protein